MYARHCNIDSRLIGVDIIRLPTHADYGNGDNGRNGGDGTCDDDNGDGLPTGTQRNAITLRRLRP
eukprot:6454616-Lingulodinium_polyedra.AAC.1